MTKLVPVLLTATAATLLMLPATPAQAASPACGKAIELINAAIDSAGGNLDEATGQALSERLLGLSDWAVGVEKDAIAGYANALVDPNITDLDPATDELNRACA